MQPTSSINFDRNGFQEDWNVVFPLDRLTELAAEGRIGSVAATHYSFMGATDPVQMVDGAKEVAGKLKADHVDAVLLTSVLTALHARRERAGDIISRKRVSRRSRSR